MNIAHFRRYRNLPFVYRGMLVEMDGRPGRIAGANRSCNLNVIFEGDDFSCNCHPFWKMKYFSRSGLVIAEFSETDNRKATRA